MRLRSRRHPQGKQVSRSLFEASDLSIDRPTGDMHARGPGSVTHVAFGTGDTVKSRTAPPGQTPIPSAKKAAELTYLNVTFQDTVQGNMQRREITFGIDKDDLRPRGNRDATLNADDPSGLGPEGMMLDSRS